MLVKEVTELQQKVQTFSHHSLYGTARGEQERERERDASCL